MQVQSNYNTVILTAICGCLDVLMTMFVFYDDSTSRNACVYDVSLFLQLMAPFTQGIKITWFANVCAYLSARVCIHCMEYKAHTVHSTCTNSTQHMHTQYTVLLIPILVVTALLALSGVPPNIHQLAF